MTVKRCHAVAAAAALLCLCAAPGAISPALAAKKSQPSSVVAPPAVPSLTLEQGDQRALALSGEVVRVATANPDAVGVNIAPPGGYVITALSPGVSMVSVWLADRSLPAAQYRVTVVPSAKHAKALIGTEAGDRTQLEVAGTSLRLSGEFNSLERHALVSEAAATAAANKSAGGNGGNASASTSSDKKTGASILDASKSAFDVQVQLDVKIVEVSRDKLKAAGFYADRSRSGVLRGLSSPGNLAGLQTNSSTGQNSLVSTSGFLPHTDAFNFFIWGANSTTVFSALENNGFAYTLAEPSLTALSGQTATFLAGGELPIPLRTGTGAESSINITFKQFGIRLAMTPTVLDGNRMAIQVAPEVSEIDESLSITTGGLSIPGLRVRRTETTVAAGDGETFVISGLVSQQSASAVDKFPILGDIPVLGAFFKSSRFSRSDKELLMIVTPHLVRPFARNAKLPALPGEELRQYEPGYLRMLFLETGTFRQADDSGFSR